jgi:hypothetical protein
VRQRVHHTRDVKDIQESQQGRPRLSAFVSIVEDLLNLLLATPGASGLSWSALAPRSASALTPDFGPSGATRFPGSATILEFDSYGK